MRSGLLRCVYTVSGKNVDYLVEFLHRKGVSVYFFDKINEDSAKICIDFKQRNKLFAISNNMSYNISKVYYKGLLSPFKTALTHIGFVVGALLFISICFFAQDFIFSVEVTGNGACFSNQTISVASSVGAKPLVRFSSLNFNEVESKILKQNKMLSFVSLKQSGNRLIIDCQLNNGYTEPFNKECGDIVSNYNGVIESIVVLRGTAVKNKGESVEKGDVLVKAYMTDLNDIEHPTFVIARISIIESIQFTFTLNDLDDNSVLLAKKTAEFNADGEVVKSDVQVNGKDVIVTVFIRRILYGG